VTPTTKNALLEAMIGTARRGLLDDGPEVVKRGSTAPVVEYSDGTAGLGVPQGLMDVWDDAQNMLTNPNYFDFMKYQPGTDYHDKGMSRAVGDSFNAAATAATGSMLAPKPANAVGVFGGRLPRNGMEIDYFGTPVQIVHNPSSQQLKGLIGKTKYKAVRRIKDNEGNVYVWDASDPALHDLVAESLGIAKGSFSGDMLGID
jgi:hypothetical protein